MKIIFLGTGGGRFATLHQTRSTGGLLLDLGSYYVSVDPGPGALGMMKSLGINPQRILGLMVSHAHPDHYSNAEIIIEGITAGGREKKGFVIGSRTVIEGGEDRCPAISSYHLGRVEATYTALPGNAVYPTPELEIWIKRMEHSDPTTVGFRIATSDGEIGYIADTAFFSELGREFAGLDILVLPVTRPLGASIPHHLCTDSALEVVREARPKLALLNHLGIKMIRADPSKEARWIESQSGVRTVAAEDGMTVSLKKGRYGLEKPSGERT